MSEELLIVQFLKINALQKSHVLKLEHDSKFVWINYICNFVLALIKL